MGFRNPFGRLHGRYQREIGNLLFRRPFVIKTQRPIVSFTFDDFPASALRTGGSILNQFGAAGTYYAAFGLLGAESASGQIFEPEDLALLLKQDHELGCHTYHHRDAWKTNARVFEASVGDNRKALQRYLPGVEFKSLSYPISPPRPSIKRSVAKYFECCRGGGQTINIGTVDLNQLSAYFIEKARGSVSALRSIIDRNREAQGWLIFATHDVCDDPTQFGCTPGIFEEVVKYSLESGAVILPVARALETLKSDVIAGQRACQVGS